jgi:hypothetical protein
MKYIVKSIYVNICLIFFLSRMALRQGDALSPLLFNFASEYYTRNVQENQVGLILNGTHQQLVYVLGDNIETIKEKNTNFN